jgi:hypothetical protein
LQKSKSQFVRNSSVGLQRLARERADEQARRIPWQRLYEVRNQYLDWQEFYLWARSIFESEKRIPDWLADILQERCLGFLEAEKALSPKARKARPLALRLEDWIDDHIFGFAKQEGWFSAITYYAIREPRYQQAEVCWSECIETWRKGKPIQYPSFEKWKAMAAQCDETAHLTVKERKAREAVKLVAPDRLTEAAIRYMDCEALAYWARHALERGSQPPAEVVCELARRCPGYLEAEFKARSREAKSGGCQHMMLWIADHFFQDAKTEGWFEALLIQARGHPRAIRTGEYADRCSEVWGSKLPCPYPAFEVWRRDADSYVELPVN